MELALVRKVFSPKSTIGDLAVDGKPYCNTLEDVVRPEGEPKVYGQTAIPAGRYVVVITFSDRFQRPLPLLLAVPNFDGIRIHSGNFDGDTDGCILVGVYDPTKPDWISNSRVMLDPLYTLIKKAAKSQKVYITISVKGNPT